MAAEDHSRAGNGQDDSPASRVGRSEGSDGRASETELPRTAKRPERAAARPTRAAREPPPNVIQATRRPRRARTGARQPDAPAEGAPAQALSDRPAAATGGSAATFTRADSDPWTVPHSVRDRFVQDGHRFFFPDGAPAFKDQGRKLTTQSENTQVIHSLIQIAQSRGWTEVTVTGTDRFRQEAWRQARLAGLSVRGYRPSEEERAQVIRALGRNLPQPTERTDSISLESVSAAPAAAAAAPAIPEG